MGLGFGASNCTCFFLTTIESALLNYFYCVALFQVVYEDSKVMAFLDKFPTVPGHTLVVPKKQVCKTVQSHLIYVSCALLKLQGCPRSEFTGH